MTQAGMFLDGVTYAVLARNMAEGLGSFWSPFYTARVYPQFHEQPPLGLGLQAVFFAIFGDHLGVERVYSLVMGGGTALLIVSLWRRTTRDTAHDWLPLLFWLLPSTVTWAIVNNMLENTQAVFTTAAVLTFVRALEASDRVGASLWSIVGGVLTIGAVLVKGPNGFFPLAAPAIAALLMPDRRRRALDSAVVCLLTVVCGAIGLLMPQAPRAALTAYSNQHVSGALSGARGASRAEAALALARHLAGGIALRMGGLLIVLSATGLIAKRDRQTHAREPRIARWGLFFLGWGSLDRYRSSSARKSQGTTSCRRFRSTRSPVRRLALRLMGVVAGDLAIDLPRDGSSPEPGRCCSSPRQWYRC